MRDSGKYIDVTIQNREARAFIPAPLPPQPPLEWSAQLSQLRDAANQALGRLDGVTRILPEKRLFLYQYVRKEAVLSSQIEGTQSSLKDLLMYELAEAPGVPIDDVEEVSNYVAALDHGLRRLRQGELPLSLRLLREMHAILLRHSRGQHHDPGEFRRTQVFIGAINPPRIQFVPPPPQHLMDCLAPMERFLHDEPEAAPALIKAGLAHVQFETIHPFMDGNGRLGRLLITLLLCADGALSEPMLYLSLFFKQNRLEYYDRLQRVRTHGDWEGWMLFFFEGVRDIAQSAVQTAEQVLALFQRDRETLQAIGRGAGSAIRVHQMLQEQPLIGIPAAAQRLSMSYPAVRAALKVMAQHGMVREITGRQRDRIYAYEPYLAILAEGTEPL